MCWLLKLATLLLVTVFSNGAHEEYSGDKVYHVEPVGEEQFAALSAAYDTLFVDVWQMPSPLGRDGYIMVKSQEQAHFEDIIKEAGIKYDIYLDDVKKGLENDDRDNEIAMEKAKRMKNGRSITFDAYHRVSDIDAYLDEVAAAHSDRVTVHDGGISFEGRPIRYLKISTTGFQDESKPIFIMEAGIHSREWAAPPVALYAIHKLVENITESDIVDKMDWIIFPMMNPDGYEFSHTSDRLWRKTRSTTHVLGQICPGVDGNRNFDFQWSATGSSSIPCAENFHGPQAFSEPEAIVFRNILIENLPRIKFYLSVHSFGSLLLYPWAWNGSLPPHALQLHLLGVQAADAIRSASIPEFPDYIVGNLAAALNYQASGSSADYALDLGIQLPFVFELPGIGIGGAGFQLPPIYIRQVVTETWEGIKVFARYVIDN